MSAADPIAGLRELAERLHGPRGPNEGESEEAIAACERRLGRQLPPILQRWYRYAGRSPVLMRQNDRLLPLDRVVIDGGLLVFFEESQADCHWVIDVSERNPDPLVLCLESDGAYDTSERLSEFLTRNLTQPPPA